MKKNILVLCLIIYYNFQITAIGNTDYLKDITARRMVIYNVLNLTEQQRSNHEKIAKEYDSIYFEKFNRLNKCINEYEIIKSAKVNFWECYSKKREINSIQHEIQNLMKSEDKYLKKNLTHSQKSKLSMINHLENMESKKSVKKDNYYKNNPNMPCFGNLCN